ncbi:hypothetical protein [Halorarum halobium]|uniref:hypothetical protein n=1 Tax=Halorarum halobium TaxID=3075121 RepID=UPI0028AAC221|nr:hypothetical protein [Halobaculum sp. XH14]
MTTTLTLPAPRRAGQYLFGASSVVLALLVVGIALVHLAAGVASAAFAGVAGLALLAVGFVAAPAGRRVLDRRGVRLDATEAALAVVGFLALAGAAFSLFFLL